jgi:LmbE family N-acetylglucosaminyl deacetylase
MAELFAQIPSVAVALYAHPDDADVGCGGTLARWAQSGTTVHLIVLTDGGRGSNDPATVVPELVTRRAHELSAASEVLGLASVTSLGFGDGEIDDTPQLRGRIVELIRRFQPQVVVGHDPTAIFFGQDYFNHRDHRMAGWLLLDAVAPAAALPHYFPEAGPAHQVQTVLLSGTLEPDVYVDIAETIDKKAKAIECHVSQFPDREGWAGDVVRQRGKEEGRRAGVAFAEGFRRLRLGA